MRDAIEMIVKSLVDESETVDVREVEQRNGTTLIEVRVAPNDVGKIIGKQGRTIRALRSLAQIAGAKKNRRYLWKLLSKQMADAGPSELVVIARAVRPRGLKGEIVAELLTDFPERFEDIEELVLVSPAGERKVVDSKITGFKTIE